MTVSMETVLMAKFRPRKNETERWDLLNNYLAIKYRLLQITLSLNVPDTTKTSSNRPVSLRIKTPARSNLLEFYYWPALAHASYSCRNCRSRTLRYPITKTTLWYKQMYIFILALLCKEKQQQLVGCFVGEALRTDQSQIQSFWYSLIDSSSRKTSFELPRLITWFSKVHQIIYTRE